MIDEVSPCIRHVKERWRRSKRVALLYRTPDKETTRKQQMTRLQMRPSMEWMYECPTHYIPNGPLTSPYFGYWASVFTCLPKFTKADRAGCHGTSPGWIHGGPKDGSLGRWNTYTATNPRRVLRVVVGRDVRVVERAFLSQWIVETAAGDVLDGAALSWTERAGLKHECQAAVDTGRHLPSPTRPHSLLSHPRASPVEKMIATVHDETADRERGRRNRIRGLRAPCPCTRSRPTGFGHHRNKTLAPPWNFRVAAEHAVF